MANKNVNILLKLQDQFTKPMRECGVITKDQERAMRRTSQSVIGFSRTVRNGFLGGAAHVLKFGAALTGVGGLLSAAGIKAFAADAIEGFNAAEEAESVFRLPQLFVEKKTKRGLNTLDIAPHIRLLSGEGNELLLLLRADSPTINAGDLKKALAGSLKKEIHVYCCRLRLLTENKESFQ